MLTPTNLFISASEFNRGALLLRHAGGDAHRIRLLLSQAKVEPATFTAYGACLAALLRETWHESDLFNRTVDASLLGDFFNYAGLDLEKVRTYWFEKGAVTEEDFAHRAFAGMNAFSEEDSARLGLEFVRVFLRTKLQAEARATSHLFTLYSNETMWQRVVDALVLDYEHPTFLVMLELGLGPDIRPAAATSQSVA